ncbi:unnamed protein product [Thelazia callipaeda]|uniref:E3 ubiquitin-protein ligase E3D n=1 Tax=Thelazia callipaeda TaxID=103827 RepID=A0A0N5D6M1_THECL|nr:unnamed protein product [Thelazia callipaeda]
MSLKSWRTRSFFIELKPKSEFASLFIDCPPTEENGQACNNNHSGTLDESNERKSSHVEEAAASTSKELLDRKEMVHIREDSIEMNAAVDKTEDIQSNLLSSYSAKFGDLVLQPNSVCALTWADNHRLFMCKVRAEVGGCPLVPKTFHRLAVDVSSRMLLDEYIESAQSHPLQAECAECSANLLNYSENSLKMQSLPEDDWLDTSPSMEYFCRDTCGGSHSHGYHNFHSSDLISVADAQKQWLPNESTIAISDSYILVLKKMITPNAVNIDDSSGVVHCARCYTELGIILKKNPDIVQFHHVMCCLTLAKESEIYINNRFGTLEHFFAWTLLYQCESQTSLKLVLRSYDKRPYLLVWLLDSYVVISQGELAIASRGEEENNLIFSFPALKMLYKIFDSESAKTDPRANGEDASVAILDMPLICCVKFTEVLLESSLALPPAGRSVGQFYVRLYICICHE